MNGGIYKILNTVTNMSYIGQAFNLQKRWKNHRIELNLNRHCNPYLQSAWNKYGSFNFAFSVIEYCDKDKLTEREQYWIDTYKAANRVLGYNLQSIAGGSSLGLKHSEETKAMWSKMRKGKELHTEASKEKISNALKGRVFSSETRERMRQAQLGKKKSEETKRKMGESRKGNKNASGEMSDKHKLAISKSLKGHIHSQESINKIIIGNTGKSVSLETRLKMSEAAKRRHNQ